MGGRIRPFEFEGLSVEVRLKIYRSLLISYDGDLEEDELQELDPTYECEGMTLHPAILRTNKRSMLKPRKSFTAQIFHLVHLRPISTASIS